MNDDMILRTWVDASYGGVHSDRRGHTDGFSSIGTGILHYKTSTQRLNTKSSTETEVVGVSNYLPHTVWLKLFFEGARL